MSVIAANYDVCDTGISQAYVVDDFIDAVTVFSHVYIVIILHTTIQ